jgi:hypothetical protein
MGRSKHAEAGPVTENADIHPRRLIRAVVRRVVPHHPHVPWGGNFWSVVQLLNAAGAYMQ